MPKEKLSEHFELWEFERSQTASRRGISNNAPDSVVRNLNALCEQVLEPVREHFGKGFMPNSGYRSPELNKAIGGSATSQHCKGEAADIEIPGVPNGDLAQWIKDNLEFDQLILECYTPGIPSSGWVHVSYKRTGGNRKQVLTYANGKYTNGLNK